MEARVRTQVESLHASSTLAVVAVTGGGVRALTWLLEVPGASRTVLEALVPYAGPALVEFLGHEVEQAAGPGTAKDMAHRAYERARRLASDGSPVAGIGCSAAIVSDRPKRGDHRCFVSAWTGDAVTTYGVRLEKGARDRPGEEEVVSKLVLRALADASHVEFSLSLGLGERESVEVVVEEHGDPTERMLAGELRSATVQPDGRIGEGHAGRAGVLPGSFDPLHKGHEELAAVAASILGMPVTFELSIENVDKPALDEAEVRRRVAQFAGARAVVVTRTPTFREKAELFHGSTFVVGWDTVVRLVDPVYYAGGRSEMLRALGDIRRAGCNFLVAGRAEHGVFRTLSEAPLPPGFEDMFTGIPESEFRCDISSTGLRPGTQRQ